MVLEEALTILCFWRLARMDCLPGPAIGSSALLNTGWGAQCKGRVILHAVARARAALPGGDPSGHVARLS